MEVYSTSDGQVLSNFNFRPKNFDGVESYKFGRIVTMFSDIWGLHGLIEVVNA